MSHSALLVHLFFADSTNYNFWKFLEQNGWWQILIVVLTALSTQFLSHFYLLRREKRGRIVELAAKLMSAGAQVRSSLTFFKEYDTDFQQQQMHVTRAARRGDSKAFDVAKEAAFFSQKTAQYFGRQYSLAQQSFTEAAFMLTAVHNSRFYNERKFMKAIVEVQAVSIEELQNFAKARQEIDSKLVPHLKEIDRTCHIVIYEQERGLFDKIKTHFERGDKKK